MPVTPVTRPAEGNTPVIKPLVVRLVVKPSEGCTPVVRPAEGCTPVIRPAESCTLVDEGKTPVELPVCIPVDMLADGNTPADTLTDGSTLVVATDVVTGTCSVAALGLAGAGAGDGW